MTSQLMHTVVISTDVNKRAKRCFSGLWLHNYRSNKHLSVESSFEAISLMNHLVCHMPCHLIDVLIEEEVPKFLAQDSLLTTPAYS